MTCSGEQTVADVCPEESCNLYGCEEPIKLTIQEGANWGIFGFTIAVTFYFAGALHLFFVGRAKYKEDVLEKIDDIPHEEEEIVDLRSPSTS